VHARDAEHEFALAFPVSEEQRSRSSVRGALAKLRCAVAALDRLQLAKARRGEAGLKRGNGVDEVRLVA
jgi:hypothetical protein